MITKDFKIDFGNKKIYHNPKGSGEKHTINELYSYLQNIFDEPENMKYDIPIEAMSKTEYFLVNGWTIDEESMENLTGGTLKSENTIKA